MASSHRLEQGPGCGAKNSCADVTCYVRDLVSTYRCADELWDCAAISRRLEAPKRSSVDSSFPRHCFVGTPCQDISVPLANAHMLRLLTTQRARS
jgi:hypothetical protein